MAFISALDQCKLTQERFEEVIAAGLSKNEILTLFDISESALNSWCLRLYHRSFPSVFSILRQLALSKYKDVLQILAARGNTTALATINQFVFGMAEQDKITKIQIVSDIPNPSLNQSDPSYSDPDRSDPDQSVLGQKETDF